MTVSSLYFDTAVERCLQVDHVGCGLSEEHLHRESAVFYTTAFITTWTYSCLARPSIVEGLKVSKRVAGLQHLHFLSDWVEDDELVANASSGVDFLNY